MATVTVRVEPNATGAITANASVSSDNDARPGNSGASEQTTEDNGHACTIIGSSGDDTITSTNGLDVMWPSAATTTISGGNGDGVIYAGSGDDRSYGDSLLSVLENGSGTIYRRPRER